MQWNGIVDSITADMRTTTTIKTKTYWKNQADKWFSEFIRLRDSDDEGIATCITSGRRMHWRDLDCGHYISRAKQATRYDEMNCHAQSKGHNRFQGGHFLEHGRRIDELYGKGTAEMLGTKALMQCRRTVMDFRILAETYRIKVMEIEKKQPYKYWR